MGDLFRDYRTAMVSGRAAFDEMFTPEGDTRVASAALHDALEALAPADFEARCHARDRRLRDQGITFSLSGEERPFPLDLVPRVLAADEWAIIEAGVIQRVKALEAFLRDVYGAAEVINDGIVPPPS